MEGWDGVEVVWWADERVKEEEVRDRMEAAWMRRGKERAGAVQ